MIHLWEIKDLLVRQPILGTSFCIERYIDACIQLPIRPMAGDTLRIKILSCDLNHPALPVAPSIDIKVDSVILNAGIYQDSSAGEIICSSMVLLPTNPSLKDPNPGFAEAVRNLGHEPKAIEASEISRIDYERWLLDGCIQDPPNKLWFDGSLQKSGYHEKFELSSEGLADYDYAVKNFVEGRRQKW